MPPAPPANEERWKWSKQTGRKAPGKMPEPTHRLGPAGPVSSGLSLRAGDGPRPTLDGVRQICNFYEAKAGGQYGKPVAARYVYLMSREIQGVLQSMVSTSSTAPEGKDRKMGELEKITREWRDHFQSDDLELSTQGVLGIVPMTPAAAAAKIKAQSHRIGELEVRWRGLCCCCPRSCSYSQRLRLLLLTASRPSQVRLESLESDHHGEKGQLTGALELHQRAARLQQAEDRKRFAQLRGQLEAEHEAAAAEAAARYAAHLEASLGAARAEWEATVLAGTRAELGMALEAVAAEQEARLRDADAHGAAGAAAVAAAEARGDARVAAAVAAHAAKQAALRERRAEERDREQRARLFWGGGARHRTERATVRFVRLRGAVSAASGFRHALSARGIPPEVSTEQLQALIRKEMDLDVKVVPRPVPEADGSYAAEVACRSPRVARALLDAGSLAVGLPRDRSAGEEHAGAREAVAALRRENALLVERLAGLTQALDVARGLAVEHMHGGGNRGAAVAEAARGGLHLHVDFRDTPKPQRPHVDRFPAAPPSDRDSWIAPVPPAGGNAVFMVAEGAC